MAAEYEADYWPCMKDSVDAFMAMQTQWRCSANGFYGLDYVALNFTLQSLQIDRDHWPIVFDDIRTMEAVALSEMRLY